MNILNPPTEQDWIDLANSIAENNYRWKVKEITKEELEELYPCHKSSPSQE